MHGLHAINDNGVANCGAIICATSGEINVDSNKRRSVLYRPSPTSEQCRFSVEPGLMSDSHISVTNETDQCQGAVAHHQHRASNGSGLALDNSLWISGILDMINSILTLPQIK